jgi:hypothetical protein
MTEGEEQHLGWIRIDDRFDEHPKFAAAGPLGLALWISGMAYCNRNLTDGFIPWTVARTLVSWDFLGPDGPTSVTVGSDAIPVAPDLTIGLLLAVDLWDEIPGGYLVHDYLEYQPSRDEVQEERERRAAAGRAGGLATARGRAVAPAKAPAVAKPPAKRQRKRTPNPNPKPKQDSLVPDGTTESRAAHANGESDDALEIQALAEELTQQPYVLANLHSKIGEMAMRQVAAHGVEAVSRTWREVAHDAGGMPTIRQVVLGADDRLNPIPSVPVVDHAARDIERSMREREEERKRLEAAMPAEQRERNLTRLRDSMTASGLLPRQDDA